MADDVPPLPALADLHERHYGLDDVVARHYSAAAAVCMQRHHVSPKSVSVSEADEDARDYLASWETPSKRQLVVWGNRDDATRDAAYGIMIAAAEAHLGLFVIGRAPPGSGSDYLFGDRPADQDEDDTLDLERDDLCRLEVSGIDRCTGNSQLEGRLREKVAQLQAGSSSLPGIAGVVAFNMARVRFRRL